MEASVGLGGLGFFTAAYICKRLMAKAHVSFQLEKLEPFKSRDLKGKKQIIGN